MSKVFRDGDKVGPDYKCSACNKGPAYRLWRESHVMLDQVELWCAECATTKEVEAIKRYAYFHQPTDCTIGNLVPARPTPDGSTFWGHTSGDIEWWYKLRQWPSTVDEMNQLRKERDWFCSREQYALADWLETLRELRELQRKVTE